MGNDKPYLIRFQKYADSRGALTPIEGSQDIPFEIKRVFYIYDLDENSVRADHANSISSEVLICLSGSCDVELTCQNGSVFRYHLTEKIEGVYIPKMIWRKVSNFKTGSVVLALSDTRYDPKEIITELNDYLM